MLVFIKRRKEMRLLFLIYFLGFLILPLKAVGRQNFFTAEEAINEARRIYSNFPGIPVVVIVRGVHERGYRVYIDSSYLGEQSLIIEIPTYIGRGNDIYCAMLDHLIGYKGRGIRILNTLNRVQKAVGNIDVVIFHSGAVVALKNVADSKLFKEVFKQDKIGKVAFAGAYVGPKLSNAMNTSGIPWHSFARGNDMIVAITKTNLQSLGLSGEFRLTPLQLLLAPMRIPASVLGGVLKVPHLALFPIELRNHPLQSYKKDIVSWLKNLNNKQKKKRKDKKRSKERKSRPYLAGDGGDGGPGGGTNVEEGSYGVAQFDTLSNLIKSGALSLSIKAKGDETMLLELQKNTADLLTFIIPNATVLKTSTGAQSMGM